MDGRDKDGDEAGWPAEKSGGGGAMPPSVHLMCMAIGLFEMNNASSTSFMPSHYKSRGVTQAQIGMMLGVGAVGLLCVTPAMPTILRKFGGAPKVFIIVGWLFVASRMVFAMTGYLTDPTLITALATTAFALQFAVASAIEVCGSTIVLASVDNTTDRTKANGLLQGGRCLGGAREQARGPNAHAPHHSSRSVRCASADALLLTRLAARFATLAGSHTRPDLAASPLPRFFPCAQRSAVRSSAATFTRPSASRRPWQASPPRSVYSCSGRLPCSDLCRLTATTAPATAMARAPGCVASSASPVWPVSVAGFQPGISSTARKRPPNQKGNPKGNRQRAADQGASLA